MEKTYVLAAALDLQQKNLWIMVKVTVTSNTRKQSSIWKVKHHRLFQQLHVEDAVKRKKKLSLAIVLQMNPKTNSLLKRFRLSGWLSQQTLQTTDKMQYRHSNEWNNFHDSTGFGPNPA